MQKLLYYKTGKRPEQNDIIQTYIPTPCSDYNFLEIVPKKIKVPEKKLIPDHQFDFRALHSITDQVHRLTNLIENKYEEKKVCVALDIAKAFSIKCGMKDWYGKQEKPPKTVCRPNPDLPEA